VTHVRGALRRNAAVLALPVLCVIGLGVTVWLDVATPASGPGVDLAGGVGWPYALLGVCLAICAAVILVVDAGQRVGWALGALGLFWVLDAMCQSYLAYGIRADEALPMVNAAGWFFFRFGAFLPVTVAFLLALFPTGRVVEGRWGHVSRIALGVMVFAAVVVILTPMKPPTTELPPDVDLDIGTLPLSSFFRDHVTAFDIAVSLIGVLATMASVVVRFRRSSGVERDRMRWLLWAVLVMAVLIVLSLVADAGVLTGTALFLVALLPAVAMTVAVVDPELVPIDDLVGRTVLYGVLTLLVVGVDLGVLALLTSVLGGSLEQRQVVLVVLLLTAVLYGPLRQQISRLVRRVMFGRRADPYDAIAGLASTLETADDGAEQLSAVTRSVAAAFGVRFVGVELDQPGGEHLVASYGERPAETRTLPITYRDVPIGRLVLPARGLRSPLSRRDEELLGDLVRQAATAARASRMADELQLGRERMVLAREEERLRIRRDLHDGLGPALSGVVFRLESARLLVDRDPETAKGHLLGTSADVREVVADVRRLVHDLRPPALDDRGLVGALGQLAEQQPFETTIEADGVSVLPAAVEVAAYRIAAEALTNATRHADAGACAVRLVAGEGELLVEVSDDGRGIDRDRQAGVGLLSMRERAEELGGRSEVTCPTSGGTVVRAWLPMRAVTAEEEENAS